MNFGQALEILNHGGNVQRSGWNCKCKWLCFGACVDDGKAPTKPLTLKTADGEMAAWVASKRDILADDWQAAQEKTRVASAGQNNIQSKDNGMISHQLEAACAMQDDGTLL